MLFRLCAFGAFVSVFIAISVSKAELINSYSVGLGDSVSYVQIEFDNDHTYVFDVAYVDDGSVNGWDLMQIIETELPTILSMQYETYSWGNWLQGLSVENDHAFGTGAGFPDLDDYWAYWVAPPGTDADWEFSSVGADNRLVSDGSWDGWTFHPSGATPPQAIPGPSVLALLLLPVLGAKRRRQLP